MARPMPVLPLVASMTVWPGLSAPVRSASSMTPSARRSLTEPRGLKASILTKRLMPAGARWLMRTTGVLPTVPRMLSNLRFIVRCSLAIEILLRESERLRLFFFTLFIEQDVGVEGAGWKLYVIFNLGEKSLTGRIACVISGGGKGGGQALDGVIVIVLFGVFVEVFELRIAGLEGAAAGKVGFGVDVEGDGVVAGSEDGDPFGDAAFDHGAALIDDHDAG